MYKSFLFALVSIIIVLTSCAAAEPAVAAATWPTHEFSWVDMGFIEIPLDLGESINLGCYGTDPNFYTIGYTTKQFLWIKGRMVTLSDGTNTQEAGQANEGVIGKINLCQGKIYYLANGDKITLRIPRWFISVSGFPWTRPDGCQITNVTLSEGHKLSLRHKYLDGYLDITFFSYSPPQIIITGKNVPWWSISEKWLPLIKAEKTLILYPDYIHNSGKITVNFNKESTVTYCSYVWSQ